MLNIIKNIYITFFFSKNDKKLINNSYLNLIANNNNNNKKSYLFELPMEYYYYFYNQLIIKEKKINPDNIIAYWPHDIFPYKKNKLNIFLFPLKKILYFLAKKKWFKIYKSLGISNYLNVNNFYFKNIIKTFNIKKKIKNKKDLLNLYIDKIYVGDLIYETFIRFRSEPTIKINDYYLNYLIFKTLNYLTSLNKIFNKRKIDEAYFSYSSYINHGLPIRFFLKKNIKVFSGFNGYQYNKELTIKDPLHWPNVFNYKKDFEKLKNKKQKIIEAKKEIKNRFAGKKNNIEIWMKKSPFKKNKIKLPKNINGVIFLHDFFDQGCGFNMIFEDFYTWTNFTLDFIQKNKLSIAVKPHPNSTPDSIKFTNILKEKYNDLIWLPSNISNREIFNNRKINMGISSMGNVLWEMRYYGIDAICCGYNYAISFDFIKVPKNVEQYKHLIINSLKNNKTRKKNINKNLIKKFYYMYFIHNQDSYKSLARKIELKKIINYPISKQIYFKNKIFDNLLKNI